MIDIDRLNTALEGRCRVERELGEGGMELTLAVEAWRRGGELWKRYEHLYCACT